MQSVYILDNDVDIAYALCALLRLQGFEVKHFSTCKELFQHLKVEHPCYIILDCLFGRVSLTSDICNTIQNEFHYTGTILLTSTSAISKKDMQACNASGFIAKPFDFEKVLA